jgi:hypothetical protein
LPDVTVTLTDFGWNALANEAERQGTSIEQLLAHAAMYYLADIDSGRLATRAPRFERSSPGPGPTG